MRPSVRALPVVLAVVAAFALAPPAAAGGGRSPQPACGDVLTRDTVLTRNLVCATSPTSAATGRGATAARRSAPVWCAGGERGEDTAGVRGVYLVKRHV